VEKVLAKLFCVVYTDVCFLCSSDEIKRFSVFFLARKGKTISGALEKSIGKILERSIKLFWRGFSFISLQRTYSILLSLNFI
jgi:hypothetical protein